MTNTTKQTKNYEDMKNEEKAQFIYNKLLQDDPKTLSGLLMGLSTEYPDAEILTVNDWLGYFKDEYLSLDLLVIISQSSKGLCVDDPYIRESIYYTGYQTSDRVLDLVDEYEAIDWIANALNDDSSYYNTVIPTLI